MRLRALVLAVLLLASCGTSEPLAPATTTTARATTAAPTTKKDRCPSLREALVDAKQKRVASGLDDESAREVVGKAAREARAAGCDISDLVGPSVGA